MSLGRGGIKSSGIWKAGTQHPGSFSQTTISKQGVRVMTTKQPNYNELYAQFDDADARTAFAISAWDTIVADMKEAGTFTPLLEHMIDRLVRDYVEYEFLYPHVTAEGPVSIGPNGGEYFNLAWSALAKLKTHILRLEESLRITPQKASEAKPQKRQPLPSDEYLNRVPNNHSA